MSPTLATGPLIYRTILLSAAGAWLVVMLIRVLFHIQINGALWMLSLLLDGLLLIAGAVIGIMLLVHGVRGKRVVEAVVMGAVIAGVAWFTLGTSHPFLISAKLKLWRNQAAYLEAVDQVKAGQPTTVGNVRIEETDPVRVAFSWGGIMDNWVGVVHDPSGEVENLKISRMWFGGMMTRATHLWGPWYLCSFT